ncbi:bifunctional (p)ppGpp synthetase/guanosine-3',5'-bis(diphosphate) 3'-pyrophosphohydrolase [Bacillus sp. BRMEA1]|uniref:HD domain-containing protein n=1 Tax=Neobacillus endophyticus TaxID=2738405 RepID=UPI001566AB12|nr:HD domain-containing protein [Neobacillus endophyticus]NRD80225.1 bifunctional (p)ppGpp synthetase/guanosine-3',5'-bis(diphosphate) 3'-pyrophosphohydrolase [Neobacillus endophyticus]
MIEKALEFAAKAHEGQVRKTNNTPMITHPIQVAEILKANGFADEVVAAGYLHDTVEDTDVTLEDIRHEFGSEVARIVAGNTEDKTKSWEERKQHTIDWIRIAPFEIKALIVADKWDNLKSMAADYEVMGDSLWNCFHRGKENQKWYYSQIAENAFVGLKESEIPSYFYDYRKLVQSFLHFI